MTSGRIATFSAGLTAQFKIAQTANAGSAIRASLNFKTRRSRSPSTSTSATISADASQSGNRQRSLPSITTGNVSIMREFIGHAYQRDKNPSEQQKSPGVATPGLV